MSLVDIAILVGIGVLIWLVLVRGKEKKDDTSTLLMQEQLKEMRGTLDTKLGGQGEAMQRLIRDITRELTKVGEGQKQVIDTAKQLESLQNILKNPKQRGMFGEYTLEVLLKGAFTSKQYKMQYKFKDGEIVDAVLFMGDKILPIDSKFSLENYNRIVEENDPVERERLEKAFIQDIKKRNAEKNQALNTLPSRTPIITSKSDFSLTLPVAIEPASKTNSTNGTCRKSFTRFSKTFHLLSQSSFWDFSE